MQNTISIEDRYLRQTSVTQHSNVVISYIYHVEEKPKDNPITVKGNSRQEIVKGKRNSWPVSKKRKGYR